MIVERYAKKYGKFITAGIIISLVLLNLYSSVKWLIAIDSFSTNSSAVEEEIILEDYFIVTNKQWNHIVDAIDDRFQDGDFSTIHVGSSPLHIRPLMYLLQINKEHDVKSIDKENIDSNGIYFYLREAKKVESNKVLPRGIEKKFDIIDKIDFGTVVLFQLQPLSVGSVKSYEQQVENKNRCYMHNIQIEDRAKCKVKDIKGFLVNYSGKMMLMRRNWTNPMALAKR